METVHYLKLKNLSMNWEKHIFHRGNGMNPKGILPIPQDVWPIDPENIYFWPMYVDRAM